MRALLAANWKMHLFTAQARDLLLELNRLGAEEKMPFPIVICPSHIHLRMAKEHLAACEVGAQNGYPGEFGAYTGEVSMAQLWELGCRYVIVGHSERRQYFGEAGALLRDKVLDAQARGLRVIYCVGETAAQRQAGQTLTVLQRQLEEVLRGATIAWSQLILAYEPVWAIGTGVNATPQQAQEAHAFIRARLKDLGAPEEAIPLLYGGSIKPNNAEALFSQPDVDGGLVGGASLVAQDFWAIAQALKKAKGASS